MRDPYDPHADERQATGPTPDQIWSSEQNRRRHADRLAAIANCPLCDTDGYRDTHVCDHTDHRAAARRHINEIRAQMGWPATKTPGTP
ncbi:hypothetical protein BTO20_05935 [Mycobacterium dioxanotrophicus]|uniref:Uncharacterized protein n=1 Tax=Mycobacterium dioxanotrophicus TaxID=482462 RepID=A0A1Y0BZ88_9MYCO|nr:hypothetical protein [Mycobacterium dioxanotrophicus]ART68186.1 hypothetical protein BTO20_05935 [Mycobacterium dioxanotrophicus]